MGGGVQNSLTNACLWLCEGSDMHAGGWQSGCGPVVTQRRHHGDTGLWDSHRALGAAAAWAAGERMVIPRHRGHHSVPGRGPEAAEAWPALSSGTESLWSAHLPGGRGVVTP